MCAICAEYQRGILTKKEVIGAMKELILTDPNFTLEHAQEISDELELEKEEE